MRVPPRSTWRARVQHYTLNLTNCSSPCKIPASLRWCDATYYIYILYMPYNIKPQRTEKVPAPPTLNRLLVTVLSLSASSSSSSWVCVKVTFLCDCIRCARAECVFALPHTIDDNTSPCLCGRHFNSTRALVASTVLHKQHPQVTQHHQQQHHPTPPLVVLYSISLVLLFADIVSSTAATAASWVARFIYALKCIMCVRLCLSKRRISTEIVVAQLRMCWEERRHEKSLLFRASWMSWRRCGLFRVLSCRVVEGVWAFGITGCNWEKELYYLQWTKSFCSELIKINIPVFRLKIQDL